MNIKEKLQALQQWVRNRIESYELYLSDADAEEGEMLKIALAGLKTTLSTIDLCSAMTGSYGAESVLHSILNEWEGRYDSERESATHPHPLQRHHLRMGTPSMTKLTKLNLPNILLNPVYVEGLEQPLNTVADILDEQSRHEYALALRYAATVCNAFVKLNITKEATL